MFGDMRIGGILGEVKDDGSVVESGRGVDSVEEVQNSRCYG